MCTKNERCKFIAQYYGFTGELPHTSVYMRWCSRNGSPISRSTAVKDIRDTAEALGISHREQPKQLKSIVRKRSTLGVILPSAPGKKVDDLYNEPIVNKPAEVPVPKARKSGIEIRAEVEKEFDEKYGKGWKSSVLKLDEVKAEVIKRSRTQSP